MKTQQLDDLADDGDVTTHRARARSKLDQITAQVKLALSKADISLVSVQSTGAVPPVHWTDRPHRGPRNQMFIDTGGMAVEVLMGSKFSAKSEEEDL